MPKKAKRTEDDEVTSKMEQLSTDEGVAEGKKKGKKKGKKLDAEAQERRYAEKMAFLLGDDEEQVEKEEETLKKNDKKAKGKKKEPKETVQQVEEEEEEVKQEEAEAEENDEEKLEGETFYGDADDFAKMNQENGEGIYVYFDLFIQFIYIYINFITNIKQYMYFNNFSLQNKKKSASLVKKNKRR